MNNKPAQQLTNKNPSNELSEADSQPLLDKDFFKFLYSFLVVILIALIISAVLNDMYLAQSMAQNALVSFVFGLLPN